jgi:hypothetical protein
MKPACKKYTMAEPQLGRKSLICNVQGLAGLVRYEVWGGVLMRTYRWRSAAFLIAILGLALGCGKETGVPAADTDANSTVTANSATQALPFDRQSQSGGISPTQTLVPTAKKLPAGTPITVRLQSTVSSKSSRSGDNFESVLDEPIVIDSQTVVPRGATLTGRVLAAKSSGRLRDPGYLRITLVSLNVQGKPVEIETSSIFVKGGSHKKRNLAMIGGGTAGGALIGGLAGGGTGALIGTAVGAAGGTGVAYGTGKKEVALETERRLTFRLAQDVELN